MAENNVKITYETLFELLRREKSRGELQQLDRTFLQDVVQYLHEKDDITCKDSDQARLFGDQEKQKTINELINIKKVIKEIYEKRERKIIDMVVNKSRTNSNLITATNVLPEEALYYDALLKVMNDHRKSILHNTLNSEKCVAKLAEPEKTTIQAVQPMLNETKIVRFLEPVPKFVGKELEPYGPFQGEDIATLPSEIADILVQKNKAVEITQNKV